MQDKAPPLIRVIRRRSGAEGVGVGLLAGAGAPRAPRAARPFSVFLFPLFCAPLVMVHISPRGGS